MAADAPKTFAQLRAEWLDKVMADPMLTPVQKVVGWGLGWHVDSRTGEAWPAVATLADLLNMNEKTVRASLKALCERGCIFVQCEGGGRGFPTRYCFSFDESAWFREVGGPKEFYRARKEHSQDVGGFEGGKPSRDTAVFRPDKPSQGTAGYCTQTLPSRSENPTTSFPKPSRPVGGEPPYRTPSKNPLNGSHANGFLNESGSRVVTIEAEPVGDDKVVSLPERSLAHTRNTVSGSEAAKRSAGQEEWKAYAEDLIKRGVEMPESHLVAEVRGLAGKLGVATFRRNHALLILERAEAGDEDGGGQEILEALQRQAGTVKPKQSKG